MPSNNQVFVIILVIFPSLSLSSLKIFKSASCCLAILWVDLSMEWIFSTSLWLNLSCSNTLALSPSTSNCKISTLFLHFRYLIPIHKVPHVLSFQCFLKICCGLFISIFVCNYLVFTCFMHSNRRYSASFMSFFISEWISLNFSLCSSFFNKNFCRSEEFSFFA